MKGRLLLGRGGCRQGRHQERGIRVSPGALVDIYEATLRDGNFAVYNLMKHFLLHRGEAPRLISQVHLLSAASMQIISLAPIKLMLTSMQCMLYVVRHYCIAVVWRHRRLLPHRMATAARNALGDLPQRK